MQDMTFFLAPFPLAAYTGVIHMFMFFYVLWSLLYIKTYYTYCTSTNFKCQYHTTTQLTRAAHNSNRLTMAAMLVSAKGLCGILGLQNSEMPDQVNSYQPDRSMISWLCLASAHICTRAFSTYIYILYFSQKIIATSAEVHPKLWFRKGNHPQIPWIKV